MSHMLNRFKTIGEALNLIQGYREKRNDIRYKIKAPACLEFDNDPSKLCMLYLYNISSGGALVGYTQPVSKKENITLHTRIPFQQKWFGREKVDFIFHGKVIRRIEEKGQIAIKFDGNYRICKSIAE